MTRLVRRPGTWFTVTLALALAGVLILTLDRGHAGPAAATSGPSTPTSPSTTPIEAKPPEWLRPLRPGEKPPQFVLFSFDGAGSHEHWGRYLSLAKSVNAHFSGFLSGIYLLTDQQRTRYTGPGHKPGSASIGFGGSAEEVATRVQDLNAAVAAGHQIGTHYNGHFCAGAEPSVGRWNTQGWTDEIGQFSRFVDDAHDRLGLHLSAKDVTGGRTPCLEGNWAAAFPAMRAAGYTFDSSQPSDGVKWPTQLDGIWEFWMPYVKVPALHKKVIMMDYNLWYQLGHSKNDSGQYTQATLETYRGAYKAAFDGNRAPLVIGNHFNDWAGGAFSRAAEGFMGEVCAKPETVCATYAEVTKWMSLQDPAVLDRYRSMPLAQAA
ncbi:MULTISPECIES: polysaccharide deacetylase [unclassified Amycolatopsis]|uniref:polysaccharide deacetylase n=1 Tax=unclassified Amycolatopsis TaxID=2618356 RepID=UPI00287B9919|nr:MULTISPECIES: polysaccharide deacetylase [unclassified Amycolatopsis]